MAFLGRAEDHPNEITKKLPRHAAIQRPAACNVNQTRYVKFFRVDLGVSKNRGTPKSSTLIRFSIINHPFWGSETPICTSMYFPLYTKRELKIVKSRSYSWYQLVVFHLQKSSLW